MRVARMLNMLAIVAGGIVMSVSVAMAASVEIKNKDGIGKYLADEKGATLYIFKKDGVDISTCGAGNGCIQKWPVFFVEKVDAAGAVQPSDFGVFTREDGKKQSTYKGQPLYYFIKDVKPGDTNGQGVNNVWFVAVP